MKPEFKEISYLASDPKIVKFKCESICVESKPKFSFKF